MIQSFRVLGFFVCRQGLGKCGNEYGPLQEIPDWSYAGDVAFGLTDLLLGATVICVVVSCFVYHQIFLVNRILTLFYLPVVFVSLFQSFSATEIPPW